MNREFGLYAPTARGARQPPPQGLQVKHDAGSASEPLHHPPLDHEDYYEDFVDDPDDGFETSPSQLSFSDLPVRQDFSYKRNPTSPVSPRWDSLANSTSAVVYDPARQTKESASRLLSPTTPSRAVPSAYPGVSAKPYRSDTPPRAFPLSSRVQEDALRRPLTSSPASTSSPGAADSSRPSTATDTNMVENFSRPRKPSVKYQPHDVPVFQPPYSRTNSGLDHDQSFPVQPPPASAAPQLSLWPRPRGLSGSSAQSTSTYSSLPHRPSNDHLNGSYRGGSLRHGNPTLHNGSVPLARPPMVAYHNPPHSREAPWMAQGDELRSSFRSQTTTSTAQGTLFTNSGTERSSVLTKTSSITEGSIINSYSRASTRANSAVDPGLSVEDVMGMYENGFESDFEDVGFSNAKRGDDENDTHEFDVGLTVYDNDASRPPSSRSSTSRMNAKLLEAMSDPLPMPGSLAIPGADARVARDSAAMFRRSLLPNSLPKDIEFGADKKLTSREKGLQKDGKAKHDSAKLVSDEDLAMTRDRNDLPKTRTPSPESAPASAPAPAAAPTLPQQPPEDPSSRDRYGFRKANAYITREQYDAWDAPYSEYLARRKKKWVAFLKDSSLMTENPNRFPPRNAKTKRFIRKGIPPEWRGAAWFYYARGPAILAKHPGTYADLVKRAGLAPKGSGKIPDVTTEVKPLVVEDIEKDLHRTFPDNVHFKPPQDASSGAAENTPGPDPDEPTIISSLRRVLHAFALYNPRIGYCQSLNFLAGMLLLFVETEEYAFWLLNVITRVYLPGTHEMSLEGSKVDLAVLMTTLKESMPAVWKHLAGDEADLSSPAKKNKKRGKDSKQIASANDPNRLPAITLCMTAWFMSCYIGTLPVETVLRVWDIFFYEGSRTLFRIALAIFKVGEPEIKAVGDPMEMFGVVQTIPRRLLDPNTLLEACYKRRNGIGHLSQDVVEEKRQERRDGIRKWKAEQDVMNDPTLAAPKPAAAGLDLAAPQVGNLEGEVRRKGTLFGRRKDREQVRAAEVM
ncbi:hypothetical protein GQ53DRAFT_641052 [Thozetella sp. PMI_491]|nr:hypothetical protein GQ53DRAFT_641052 [Thozetella sp. PMI_491]